MRNDNFNIVIGILLGFIAVLSFVLGYLLAQVNNI